MVSLIGLMLSIGLADSINPSTLAPALYLAATDDARRNVTQFTLGVLAVNGVAGATMVLGGQTFVPQLHGTALAVVETAAGAVMLITAAVLWARRRTLQRRELRAPAEGRSSIVLGLTISAVELPTAFPYLAALAAIVGAGLTLPEKTVLLALYNLCFVLPLLSLIVYLAVAGDQAEGTLVKARVFLERHWPGVLAGLALIAGTVVALLGANGLAS